MKKYKISDNNDSNSENSPNGSSKSIGIIIPTKIISNHKINIKIKKEKQYSNIDNFNIYILKMKIIYY